MPIMYPPRAKGQALNVHVSRVPEMAARGWSFEPVDEGQRLEAPRKLSGAERAELRSVLGDAIDEMQKLTGDKRAAIRAAASYEPPTPRRRRKRKDTET